MLDKIYASELERDDKPLFGDLSVSELTDSIREKQDYMLKKKSLEDVFGVSVFDESSMETYEDYLFTKDRLYGFLSHNTKIYRFAKSVLDRVLATFSIDLGNVKFDIIDEKGIEGLVFTSESHVFISKGLLGLLLSDDRFLEEGVLAAFFAHELTHVKNKNFYALNKVGEESGVKGFVFPREDERSADVESLDVLDKAGMNPENVLLLLERLKRFESPELYNMYSISVMMRDVHDPLERRIEEVRKVFMEGYFLNRSLIEQDNIESKYVLNPKGRGLYSGGVKSFLDDMSKIDSIEELYVVSRYLVLQNSDDLKERFYELMDTEEYGLRPIDLEFMYRYFFASDLGKQEIVDKYLDSVDFANVFYVLSSLIKDPENFDLGTFEFFIESEGLKSELFGYYIVDCFDKGFSEKWLLSILNYIITDSESYRNLIDAKVSDTLKFLGKYLEKSSNFSLEFKKGVLLLFFDSEIADFIFDSADLSFYVNMFQVVFSDPSVEDLDLIALKKRFARKFYNRFFLNLPYVFEEDDHPEAIYDSEISSFGGVLDGVEYSLDSFLAMYNFSKGLDFFDRLFAIGLYKKIDRRVGDNDEIYYDSKYFIDAVFRYLFKDVNLKYLKDNDIDMGVLIDLFDDIPVEKFLDYSYKLSFKVSDESSDRVKKYQSLLTLNKIKSHSLFLYDTFEERFHHLSSYVLTLPKDPESNKVLGLLLKDAATDNLGDVNRYDLYKAYMAYKNYFLSVPKNEVFERLDREYVENGFAVIFKDMDLDFSSSFLRIISGEENAYFDEVAYEFWQMGFSDLNFYKPLDFEGKVRFIVDFFPEEGVMRDIVLAQEFDPKTESEYEFLLQFVKLPYLRDEFAYGLWKFRYEKLSQLSFWEGFDVILDLFPRVSSYRDFVINEYLLVKEIDVSDFEKIREYLFSENIFGNLEGEELYQAFVVQSLSKLAYSFSPEVKEILFASFVDKMLKKDSDVRVLSKEDRLKIFRSFYEGPNSIVDSPSMRVDLKKFFLKSVFSLEDINLLFDIEKMQIDYDRLKVLSNKLHDEEIEDHNGMYYGENDYDQEKELEKSYQALSNIDVRERILDVIDLSSLWKLSVDDYDTWDEFISAFNSILGKVLNYEDFLKEDYLENVLVKLVYTAKRLEFLRKKSDLEFGYSKLINIFFEILDSFEKSEKGLILSKFLSKIALDKNYNLNEIIVIFLEILGPVFKKAGQILASQGYFDPKLRDYLLKLSAEVDPIEVWKVWDILEYLLKSSVFDIETFGPLMGSASVRQVHKLGMKDGQSKVVKFKKPDALNGFNSEIAAVNKFVHKVERNTRILDGLSLPKDLVDRLLVYTKAEVLGDDDIAAQKEFYDRYNGQTLGEKTLCVPVVDEKLSSKYLVFETVADGLPLSSQMNLSDKEKLDLLNLFLDLIFVDGKYHADPHPGNVLSSESDISLIDYGIMGTLSEDNKALFFEFLNSFMSLDVENIMRTVLRAHVMSGDDLSNLDVPVVLQELKVFMSDLNLEESSFQDLLLKFLYTLDAVKIRLPFELKDVFVTFSRLGYLIEGNEMALISRFMESISASVNALNIRSDFRRKYDSVENYLKNLDFEGDNTEVKILSGSLIMDQNTGKTFELSGDLVISELKVQEMMGMPALKINFGEFVTYVLKGQKRYNVRHGGKWVPIADLLFQE